MSILGILNNLWAGLLEIFRAMFSDLSILWFLAPILFFWFILEVYFSRYKKEQLGWNTALGNGLSVFWLLIVCMKYLFEDNMANFDWTKFIALVIILLYAGFIITNSFMHELRKRISFLLASPTITYYLSGVAILWTFGNLKITMWVLIDLILLCGVVLIVDLVLRKLIKGKESGLGDIDKGFGKESEFKEKDIGSSMSSGGNYGQNYGGFGGGNLGGRF